jgi:Rrf2 family transcriptional regulator, nitric oxide-sensitive transcriptional repressor
MRMTQHSDYGLRMLTYLAARPDRQCTVSEIASVYGLSRNHLLKVALKLKNSAFVASARGRAGGLRLAKPASEIGIGAVVRCLEEDFVLVECFGSRGGCIIAPACRLKGVFGEALAAYLAVLDKYTLQNLIENMAALRPLFGLDISSGPAPAVPRLPTPLDV